MVACGALGDGAVTEGVARLGDGDAVVACRRWCPVPDVEPVVEPVVEPECWGAVVDELPEPVCVAAPIPNDAPTAPTTPSEASPVWSRLLR